MGGGRQTNASTHNCSASSSDPGCSSHNCSGPNIRCANHFCSTSHHLRSTNQFCSPYHWNHLWQHLWQRLWQRPLSEPRHVRPRFTSFNFVLSAGVLKETSLWSLQPYICFHTWFCISAVSKQ